MKIKSYHLRNAAFILTDKGGFGGNMISHLAHPLSHEENNLCGTLKQPKIFQHGKNTRGTHKPCKFK